MSLVYSKIAAVQAALAKSGISKSRRNQQQGYNFRGIDEVYDALAPLLASNGLCILPRILSRSVTERTTAKGGVLFYVTVEAEFDFVAAEDGSIHVVKTFGEAMDSADKATNKAMSAAYKYAALMAFAIPTEGDNDADAVTHEVAPEPEEMPDHEWTNLVTLMQSTNTGTKTLVEGAQIILPNNTLRCMSQDDYAKATEWLNTKLARMAKEETDKKAKEQTNA